MPPSPLFQLFKKTGCDRLVISTTLVIPRATVTRLRKGKSAIWFAKTFPGEGKLKVALSGVLRPATKTENKGQYDLKLFSFPTQNEPPDEFLPYSSVESHIAGIFDEREVNVEAE